MLHIYTIFMNIIHFKWIKIIIFFENPLFKHICEKYVKVITKLKLILIFLIFWV